MLSPYHPMWKASLDTLTDGSEFTGYGSVFLTIRRSSLNTLRSKPTATSSSTTTILPTSNNPNNSSSNCTQKEEEEKENDQNDDEYDDGVILARYSLTGVSTLTSRLAADQNFKLSPICAVFSPSRLDPSCTVGIPSLLLSLAKYSLTGKLHMVGPHGMDKFMDEIVQLTLGNNRAYPTVTTCVVPNHTKASWWKVYEDSYIFVHARYCDTIDTDNSLHPRQINTNQDDHLHDKWDCTKNIQSSLAYIISIKESNTTATTSQTNIFSFAVLPPGLHLNTQSATIFNPLPDFLLSDKKDISPLIFILHTNPKGVFYFKDQIMQKRYFKSNSKMNCITNLHLATIPNDDGNSNWDDGILIRATQQTKRLNKFIPWAFPVTNINNPQIDSYDKHSMDSNITELYKLCSCTSLNIMTNIPSVEGGKVVIKIINRKKPIFTKVINKYNDDNQSLECATLEQMNNYYCLKETNHLVNETNRKSKLTTFDENEISLSDEESMADDMGHEKSIRNEETSLNILNNPNETHYRETKRVKVDYQEQSNIVNLDENVNILNPNEPHLLILGTGCASPSPLRGSSGMALLLPSMDVESTSSSNKLSIAAIIDAGEGCLLSLSRYIGTRTTSTFSSTKSQLLSTVRFIWISHAHLDHYGELPLLVKEILSSKHEYQKGCNSTTTSRNYTPNYDDEVNPKPSYYHNGKSRNNNVACEHEHTLTIIAPPKVLKYLDLSLDCKYEVLRKSCNRYFSVSNQDFDSSPFAQHIRDDIFQTELFKYSQNVSNNTVSIHRYYPITMLRSFPVEHCPNAYGLILGINTSQMNHSFSICYSGDTRPSQTLIQQCKRIQEPISLLIHEATFDDDEKGKVESKRKRHSTVNEAIQVHEDIGSKACLLTHFSQRYTKLQNSMTSSRHEERIGVANDGLLLPLNDGLSDLLPLISSCANIILGNNCSDESDE